MPALPNRPRYAARLNAFKTGLPGKPTAADMIARTAQVEGLDAADLNYPDHFADHSPQALSEILSGSGMALNGLAMRYYTDPGFRLGAFTNPDPKVRQAAIDITKRGLDALAAMGGKVMTLWMGQDGVDYSFQGDYARMWDDTISSIQAVADHNRDLEIAIEYKPNEPRAYALMPDIGTTLLAIREADRPNLGVTLDFAHVLYADEIPAHSARLIERHSKLLGVHLNDGYGKRDDGLMVGSVHPVQTVELFVELDRMGYDGVIYFDTFPDHGGLDPCAEAYANIMMAERLRAVASDLRDNTELAEAITRQDATASLHIVADALYGPQK
ncbi:TIM barrel protein [Hoeflea sp.]|uniref:TIM barrel protein n=1 Tax=Hoeflea sp. TaxID=1940281 RepID=UPI003749F952